MDLAKKRKIEENGVFPPDSSTTTTSLSHDDLRNVIEPFTHEQLSEIVLNASVSHPDVLDAVRSLADRHLNKRKLFIRGLGWETTTEKLRALFATYGDLIEATVIVDKVTGKSKGYGFVTYKHIDGALMALKEPSKQIDGRMTVTKLRSTGYTNGVVVTEDSQTLDASSRKIYVWNIPHDMPGDRLLAHFSSYGEVAEGPLGFDKPTDKSKKFALFIYKNVEGAMASLIDPIKNIDGHQLNCRLADDSKRGNPSGMAAPPAATTTAAQVQGSGPLGDGAAQPQVVNLNQKSTMQGSFTSQFSGGIPAYGGNLGGLGLPGGPGGISGYGGGGQGPPLGHSQPLLNLNLGSGSGLSLGGGQPPSSLGGGSGGSHFGVPGPGASYGRTGGAGGVGLGIGSCGSGQRSPYGLPPGSLRISFRGNPESATAHYSLSSGPAYQTQPQHKTGMSPVTRVPTRGIFQGPPYKL